MLLLGLSWGSLGQFKLWEMSCPCPAPGVVLGRPKTVQGMEAFSYDLNHLEELQYCSSSIEKVFCPFSIRELGAHSLSAVQRVRVMLGFEESECCPSSWQQGPCGAPCQLDGPSGRQCCPSLLPPWQGAGRTQDCVIVGILGTRKKYLSKEVASGIC